MDFLLDTLNKIGLELVALIVSSDFNANPSICEVEYGGISFSEIISSFRTRPLELKTGTYSVSKWGLIC